LRPTPLSRRTSPPSHPAELEAPQSRPIASGSRLSLLASRPARRFPSAIGRKSRRTERTTSAALERATLRATGLPRAFIKGWETPDARASWRIEVAAGGRYEVWLGFAPRRPTRQSACRSATGSRETQPKPTPSTEHTTRERRRTPVPRRT
jgi:hypothetical protein